MKKNPFKLLKDKYLWYCTKCWMTGTIATNPDTLTESIKKTCYSIHELTNINRCKGKLSDICIHKHKKKSTS